MHNISINPNNALPSSTAASMEDLADSPAPAPHARSDRSLIIDSSEVSPFHAAPSYSTYKPAPGLRQARFVETPAFHAAATESPSSQESSTARIEQAAKRFEESLQRDIQRGNLSPHGQALAQGVLAARANTLDPIAMKMQVSTFAVDGLPSKDMAVIRSVPENDASNVATSPLLFYMPRAAEASSHALPSFYEFNNRGEFDAWLRETANDTDRLKTFSRHFEDHAFPKRAAHVKEVMRQFAKPDRYYEEDGKYPANAVIGPYRNEVDDIFAGLHRDANGAWPSTVNGWRDVRVHRRSEDGKTTYLGTRPDGGQVLFTYDAYGNLLGSGDKGDFYLLRDGVNDTVTPVRPMTAEAFKNAVASIASGNVKGNDLGGLRKSLVETLANPYYGIPTLLKLAGVEEKTADGVGRYMDNPAGAALIDSNAATGNLLGDLFGFDEATVNQKLEDVGNTLQYFVPHYGRVRFFGKLLAKALKNEPLSADEQQSLGETIGLMKPKPPLVKHQPSLVKPKPPLPTTAGSKPRPFLAPPKGETSPTSSEPPASETPKLGWNKSIHAKGVSLAGSKPNELGIHEIGDRGYIDLEGHTTRVMGLRDNGQPNFVDERGHPVSANIPDVSYEGGGKWKVYRMKGGGGDLEPVDTDSDSEFVDASESIPVKPYTEEELALMRQETPYSANANKMGSYNRANNGKYPLRDEQGKPIRIREMNTLSDASDSGVKYQKKHVLPYIKYGGYESTASLYEEKLQLRKFTEADIKDPGERALVGQDMVVANRRIAKGEVIGVYGGNIISKSLAARGGDTFHIAAGYKIRPSTEDVEPIILAGNNIISRINTNFEYDANGAPIHQAKTGYNIEYAKFDVTATPGNDKPANLSDLKRSGDLRPYEITAFFATEDIPAGTELRWNYGYSDEVIRSKFARDKPSVRRP